MTTKQLGAGAALEATIRDDLPANVELDPREDALLAAAAAQADDIAALEDDIRARGRVLDGLVNPLRSRGAKAVWPSDACSPGSTFRRRRRRPSCAPREPPRRGGAHVIPTTSPKTHDDEVLAALAQLKAT